MDGFEDFDDFHSQVQGKPVRLYRNGEFENFKTFFIQHHWTWDEFLSAVSQRLELTGKASRVFNADGAEIEDIMVVEDDDMLFFSTGEPFKAPVNPEDDGSPVVNGGAGSIVGGYKVDAFLGRGGFGEVRLGIHQVTKEKVALKFILKAEMGTLSDVDRTTIEIQCLTALNHPNIIKLLRVMNEPEHLVLSIELLKGGDLHHMLRDMPEGEKLKESDCRTLFTQIVAGVGYAHNQHICHRDLKLENILLSEKNSIENIKIADFGLSDFYRPGAVMKTNCGSLSYLAPEVLNGSCNAGPPLDVWSLGVILYAIFTRRLPFDGPDLKGTNRPRESVIKSRILRGTYKIDDFPELSANALSLLKSMLNLDPVQRATIPDIFNHPWINQVPGVFLDDEEEEEEEKVVATVEKKPGELNISTEENKVEESAESTTEKSSQEKLSPKSSSSSPKQEKLSPKTVMRKKSRSGGSITPPQRKEEADLPPAAQRSPTNRRSSGLVRQGSGGGAKVAPITSRVAIPAATTSSSPTKRRGSRRTMAAVAVAPVPAKTSPTGDKASISPLRRSSTRKERLGAARDATVSTEKKEPPVGDKVPLSPSPGKEVTSPHGGALRTQRTNRRQYRAMLDSTMRSNTTRRLYAKENSSKSLRE